MTARPWISGRDYTVCWRIAKAAIRATPKFRAKGDTHLISTVITGCSRLPPHATQCLLSTRRFSRTCIVNVLALCGSLRAASMNAALLRATARLAPDGLTVAIFPGLAELPLFNPDLEADMPASARRLQAAIAACDALLIASPEYAHGVTAVIKNALDWLVSFPPFVDKPVAIFNASPRSVHADAALARNPNYHVGATSCPTPVSRCHFAAPASPNRVSSTRSTPRPSAARSPCWFPERLCGEVDRHSAGGDRRRRCRFVLVRRLQRRVEAARAAGLPRAQET